MFFKQLLILMSAGRLSVNRRFHGKAVLNLETAIRQHCMEVGVDLHVVSGNEFSQDAISRSVESLQKRAPLAVVLSAPIGRTLSTGESGLPPPTELLPVGRLNSDPAAIIATDLQVQPAADVQYSAFAIGRRPKDDVLLSDIAEAIAQLDSEFSLVAMDGLWQPANAVTRIQPALISRSVGSEVMAQSFASLTDSNEAMSRRMILASCRGEYDQLRLYGGRRYHGDHCNLLTRLLYAALVEGEASGYGSQESQYHDVSANSDDDQRQSQLVVSKASTLTLHDLQRYLVDEMRNRVGERMGICGAVNPLFGNVPFWTRDLLK